MSFLKRLQSSWLQRIAAAEQVKKKQFDEDAAVAMNLFRVRTEEVWSRVEKTLAQVHYWRQPDGGLAVTMPKFRIVLAKAAELVQLFGPALYQENPRRIVSPRVRNLLPQGAFPSPQSYEQYLTGFRQRRAQAQAVADLLTTLLNYLASENDLHTEMRLAIDEALIKGMGVLWHELEFSPVGGTPLVASRYDTVDRLLLDPDVERRRDCTWIARERIQPHWIVEERFGLPRGYLKNAARYSSAGSNGKPANVLEQGKGDLVKWYEIFSKRGWGVELEGELAKGLPKDLRYVYLAISPNYDYPLNLLPAGTPYYDWSIPFWADNGWPYTEIAFHEVPRQLWPMSHLKPGLGELNFLNWAFSFLADRMPVACRTLIGTIAGISEEAEDKLLAGETFDIIKLESAMGKSLREVIDVVNLPPVNTDIWTLIVQVMQRFNEAVGLNEIMYGQTSRAMRSATEGKILEAHATTRVDDMAQRVAEASAVTARREAFACRWVYEGDDIRRILGDTEAQLWNQLVVPQDIEGLIRDFEITIDADSARRPNRAAQLDRLQEMFQYAGQQIMQLAAQGITGPFNAFMRQWAKLTGLPDVDRFLLDENEIIQKQMQQAQLQMQLQQQMQQQAQEGQQPQEPEVDPQLQREQAKLQMQQLREQVRLQAEQAKQQLKLQEKRMDLAFKAEQHAEKLRQQRELAQAQLARKLMTARNGG